MMHYKRLRYVKNVGVNCVLILHLCLELTKKIIKHLLHFMIRIVGIGNNMFEHGKISHEHGVSYGRGIPYYDLEEMKKSVRRCHILWKKRLPMYDTMYYLGIMPYGNLQRKYKCGSG